MHTIEALKKIGSLVRSVHCKDATWADNPGKEWGAEVPLGEGQVGMETYLQTLNEIGYAGPLTIEREIPQEPERQKVEIGAAVKLLEQLREKLAATPISTFCRSGSYRIVVVVCCSMNLFGHEQSAYADSTAPLSPGVCGKSTKPRRILER